MLLMIVADSSLAVVLSRSADSEVALLLLLESCSEQSRRLLKSDPRSLVRTNTKLTDENVQQMPPKLREDVLL